MSPIKNRLSHHPLPCFVLSLCIVCLLPARASAWGAAGHRIIARVASAKFTEVTRARIGKLLDRETLESAAQWADQRGPKDQTKGPADTAHWHFVDIPLDADNYVPRRDCRVADNTCLIEAIERQAAILRDEGESLSRRREALKYVLHLVGDLHQPFHVAADDNAGYEFRVRYLNKTTNLHEVWDTDLISTMLTSTRMTESQYAQSLASKFDSEAGRWSRDTVAYWAIESHMLAREIYSSRGQLSAANSPAQQPQGAANEPSVSKAYYNQHKPTVEKQLAKAGFRLARVLNSLFDSPRAR